MRLRASAGPPRNPRLPELLSDTNARLAAARRLVDRRARRASGRFLAEGAQAVREALHRPGTVLEVFATEPAITRHPWLPAAATDAGVSLDVISEKAAAGLSETVTPQGLVAVCRWHAIGLAEALGSKPALMSALIDVHDPGNAGTVLRTSDAAGATAVVFSGGVDVYNGKAVRASAGSLFHLDVVIDADIAELLGASAAIGLNRLATTADGECELDVLIDDQTLRRPTLWLFGSEAHGLPDQILSAADARVRVPIYGLAESLNLAAAAAVCLYASAYAQHARTRKPA